MSAASTRHTGWHPIPVGLKVLPFVMALWAIGSAANFSNLMTGGLPFFGTKLYGMSAVPVVLFFDFVGPLIFLVGLWNRAPWAPKWAAVYIGLFVLNGLVTLVTFAGEFGVAPILAPCAVNLAILAVILWKRDYFAAHQGGAGVNV